MGAVVDENADKFTGGEVACDLSVDPGDRRKLPRPVGPVMWPSEPGGFVRLPLGRMPEAELAGRRRRCGCAFHEPAL